MTGSNGQPTITERTLAELWSEVLETDDTPDATDDFFALGGDSMSMVMLEYRIKEELAVQLAPGAVVGAPTLRELANLVDASRGDHGIPQS